MHDNKKQIKKTIFANPTKPDTPRSIIMSKIVTTYNSNTINHTTVDCLKLILNP